jgi:signal peptidase I
LTTCRRQFAALLVVAIGTVPAAGCGEGSHRTYETPSESMEPTLTAGESVRVDEGAYDDAAPQVGDIVLFRPPKGAYKANLPDCGVREEKGRACPVPRGPQAEFLIVIKRVVADPGDTVSLQDGHPLVNGVIAQEDFINPNPCRAGGAPCNLPRQITVPPDHYFVLGDNRAYSDDSRLYGPVPSDWIIGRVDQ